MEEKYLLDTKPGFVKPIVENFGQDGNAFALMGQVKNALDRAGHGDVAAEFTRRALSSHSYEEVLLLCGKYGDLDFYESDEEDEWDEEEDISDSE